MEDASAEKLEKAVFWLADVDFLLVISLFGRW